MGFAVLVAVVGLAVLVAVAGLAVLVAVAGVEVDVAALAIAAPPPPKAAVSASAVSTGLILGRNVFTSFLLTQHTIVRLRRSSVGGA